MSMRKGKLSHDLFVCCYKFTRVDDWDSDLMEECGIAAKILDRYTNHLSDSSSLLSRPLILEADVVCNQVFGLIKVIGCRRLIL